MVAAKPLLKFDHWNNFFYTSENSRNQACFTEKITALNLTTE